MRGKEFLDPPPVQYRFGRQDEPHEVEAVAQAQAKTWAMDDVAIAIDDVRQVPERVARIEGEEFIFDGNSRIACGGDRRKQVECTTEFLVEDGTRHIVAGLRTAAQKQPATQPLFRLVDRDVLAGKPRVPDEISGRRQSAKPATDNMRFHRLVPWTPGWEVLETPNAFKSWRGDVASCALSKPLPPPLPRPHAPHRPRRAIRPQRRAPELLPHDDRTR